MRISEVIDLSVSGNYKCPDWVDNPIAVHGATGGLLGTTLVTCGGWPFSNKCYKMKANIGYSRFPPKNYKNYNAQSTLIEKEYDDSKLFSFSYFELGSFSEGSRHLMQPLSTEYFSSKNVT